MSLGALKHLGRLSGVFVSNRLRYDLLNRGNSQSEIVPSCCGPCGQVSVKKWILGCCIICKF